MGDRRALLTLIPAALASRLLPAQVAPPPRLPSLTDDDSSPVRLPNGTLQRDAIVKSDYAKNLKDARELIDLAKAFEEDLEKDDRYVLSLSTLKKLDEMDKTIRRIRDRLKHA